MGEVLRGVEAEKAQQGGLDFCQHARADFADSLSDMIAADRCNLINHDLRGLVQAIGFGGLDRKAEEGCFDQM